MDEPKVGKIEFRGQPNGQWQLGTAPIPQQPFQIIESGPDAAERRRYALLQAAAVIYSGALMRATDYEDLSLFVHDAESLLSEIESREKGQPG